MWGGRGPSTAMGIVSNELKLKSFYTNLSLPSFFVLCFKLALFIKNMTLFTDARVPVNDWLAQKCFK